MVLIADPVHKLWALHTLVRQVVAVAAQRACVPARHRRVAGQLAASARRVLVELSGRAQQGWRAMELALGWQAPLDGV